MGQVLKRDSNGHLVPTTDLTGVQAQPYVNHTALVANADGNKLLLLFERTDGKMDVFDGTDPHAYNCRGINDGSAVGNGATGSMYMPGMLITWPGAAFPANAVKGVNAVAEGDEAWADSDGGITNFAGVTTGKETVRVGVWAKDSSGAPTLDFHGPDPSSVQTK